ncbi:UDP-N-acetylglucosamine 1-carboxyvinyltransferase [Vibrio sp. Isolate33]|uniref:UDP-N-acetylglucosamine 1-carboxyvinyltransferase n=1 Tax=Vibrio sp. Isolate33 TaxID=2908539 RepID=UPI001EFE9BEF|nr:UDP-N-acetylglucosamine 1-carboxyvinyltransferase [Vibrio sp. Isolate33]MCG9544443.1 UDP-N-acetylglucosamine 1-carboxyvinyltransferase [Vibrio sp. Isolate33]
MQSNLIVRPSKLEGDVELSGAKNAVLKLLAASILTDEDVEISNFPHTLSDALIHLEMLEVLGKKTTVDVESKRVYITQENELSNELNWSGRSIRNTLLILGAGFAKLGKMTVPHPGGCKLGDRKFDIHLAILEAFGGEITETENTLSVERKGPLKGTDIHLPMRSTGATENAILIASLANGTSNIWNPHIRPEIINMIEMLNNMGANIVVKGQERIIVHGTRKLKSVKQKTILDNMEALTWCVGALITGGTVKIENFPFEHLELPLIYLRESGANIYRNGNSAIIAPSEIYPLDISTGPYPGINSDMQPILAAFAACAYGETTIVDLRFVGRYAYAEQFEKLNISTEVRDMMLKIKGNGRNAIIGGEVEATDLRAGIALTLLGLASKNGETKISNAWQIERGYCDIWSKLKALGANFE